MVGSAAAYSASATVVAMAKGNGSGKGVRGGASAGANKVTRPPRITSNVKQSLRILKFWKCDLDKKNVIMVNIEELSEEDQRKYTELQEYIKQQFLSGAKKDRSSKVTLNQDFELPAIKLNKDKVEEYERRQTSGPQPATRYRKKKVMKEVLPEDTDLYEDPSSTLQLTNEGLEIASPVILVDGYNVCGYWGKLKKDFMNGRQEIARQMLIDDLVSFSAVREVKVVVVFDAANSGVSTHKETYKGVDVVYSSDLSADSWIEKEVEALVADGCPKVWVVTSDALEQQLAHGEGALIWSSKRLVKEIKESEKELDLELKETRSTSLQGKLLQHKLNPKVVHALKGLRNKLEEQERRKK